MLAHFTTQASSSARTPEELVKLKCKLISNFSINLSRVFSSISLRSQIMRCYDNILQLLSSFPAARDSHFILGKQVEFVVETLLWYPLNDRSLSGSSCMYLLAIWTRTTVLLKIWCCVLLKKCCKWRKERFPFLLFLAKMSWKLTGQSTFVSFLTIGLYTS